MRILNFILKFLISELRIFLFLLIIFFLVPLCINCVSDKQQGVTFKRLQLPQPISGRCPRFTSLENTLNRLVFLYFQVV